MNEKAIIQKELVNLENNLANVTFKDQYTINNIALEASRIYLELDFNALTDLRKSIGKCNDYIKDVFELVDINSNLKQQNLFMIGQISMLSKITNEIYKLLLNNMEENIDLENSFIRNMLSEIGLNNTLSHKELAERLKIQPASLSMRLKRNPSWKKYVATFINPNKQNSIVYVLNGNGKNIYNAYLLFNYSGLNINELTQVKYCELEDDDNYECEKERITYLSSKSKQFNYRYYFKR